MGIIIGSIATALNFILIYWKFQNNRSADATLDLAIFIILCGVFGTAGGASGIYVGMGSGLLISIYLYFNPPKLPNIGKSIDRLLS